MDRSGKKLARSENRQPGSSLALPSKQSSGSRPRDGILSERVVEHEVKIPKRVIREEIVEKVVVIPETFRREDLVEDTVNVLEKIVEVAKPVYKEKVVYVPEIEYRDKVVEVVEKVIKEKIKEVPKIEYKERIVHVPKVVQQERIVEVPEFEYREVMIEKIVEVPEYREQVVLKEVPVPQYVDKPVPQYRTVEVPEKHIHNVPVPIEAVTHFAYQMPKLQPIYNPIDMTVYIPRFIEVPVPAQFIGEAEKAAAMCYAQQLNIMATQQDGIGITEMEKLAASIRRDEFGRVFNAPQEQKVQMLSKHWNQNRGHAPSVVSSSMYTDGTTSAAKTHIRRHLQPQQYAPPVEHYKTTSRFPTDGSARGTKYTKSNKVQRTLTHHTGSRTSHQTSQPRVGDTISPATQQRVSDAVSPATKRSAAAIC